MNKVLLKGMIINELETKQMQNGTMTVRISLSVFRTKNDGGYVNDIINCIAFGKNAENISKYCAKGSSIIVEGNIKTGSYTSKEGKKVYTTDVWVEKTEFLDKKSDQIAAPVQPPQAYTAALACGQQAYTDFGYPDYPMPY